ncbi:hypothetical protein S40288_10515 [Stachybotrys chartarum IBT 40288]|nr:hypothetical protein S40288_10515 [Stachybotrys chartarum IBT 40288]
MHHVPLSPIPCLPSNELSPPSPSSPQSISHDNSHFPPIQRDKRTPRNQVHADTRLRSFIYITHHFLANYTRTIPSFARPATSLLHYVRRRTSVTSRNRQDPFAAHSYLVSPLLKMVALCLYMAALLETDNTDGTARHSSGMGQPNLVLGWKPDLFIGRTRPVPVLLSAMPPRHRTWRQVPGREERCRVLQASSAKLANLSSLPKDPRKPPSTSRRRPPRRRSQGFSRPPSRCSATALFLLQLSVDARSRREEKDNETKAVHSHCCCITRFAAACVRPVLPKG